MCYAATRIGIYLTINLTYKSFINQSGNLSTFAVNVNIWNCPAPGAPYKANTRYQYIDVANHMTVAMATHGQRI